MQVSDVMISLPSAGVEGLEPPAVAATASSPTRGSFADVLAQMQRESLADTDQATLLPSVPAESGGERVDSPVGDVQDLPAEAMLLLLMALLGKVPLRPPGEASPWATQEGDPVVMGGEAHASAGSGSGLSGLLRMSLLETLDSDTPLKVGLGEVPRDAGGAEPSTSPPVGDALLSKPVLPEVELPAFRAVLLPGALRTEGQHRPHASSDGVGLDGAASKEGAAPVDFSGRGQALSKGSVGSAELLRDIRGLAWKTGNAGEPVVKPDPGVSGLGLKHDGATPPLNPDAPSGPVEAARIVLTKAHARQETQGGLSGRWSAEFGEATAMPTVVRPSAGISAATPISYAATPEIPAFLEARPDAAPMTAGTDGLLSVRPTLQVLADYAVKSVRYLVSEGKETLRVRLVPDTLGELRVDVRTAHRELSVRLVSANPMVREVLKAQVPLLQESLNRDGLSVSAITVMGDASAGQAADAHMGRQPAQSGGGPSVPPPQTVARGYPEEPVALIPRRSLHVGALNVFV